MKRISGIHSARQGGAALIVVLLLLLIVTLIGLASMRGAILQERMAAATYSRSMAFQAAEAALKEAEAMLASDRPVPPAANCTNGICAMTAPGATPPWKSAAFWSTAANRRAATAVNTGTTAHYTVEDYGFAKSSECASSAGTNPLDMSAPPCIGDIRVYRVIARSTTNSGSEVMLQSLFRTP